MSWNLEYVDEIPEYKGDQRVYSKGISHYDMRMFAENQVAYELDKLKDITYTLRDLGYSEGTRNPRMLKLVDEYRKAEEDYVKWQNIRDGRGKLYNPDEFSTKDLARMPKGKGFTRRYRRRIRR